MNRISPDPPILKEQRPSIQVFFSIIWSTDDGSAWMEKFINSSSALLICLWLEVRLLQSFLQNGDDSFCPSESLPDWWSLDGLLISGLLWAYHSQGWQRDWIPRQQKDRNNLNAGKNPQDPFEEEDRQSSQHSKPICLRTRRCLFPGICLPESDNAYIWALRHFHGVQPIALAESQNEDGGYPHSGRW